MISLFHGDCLEVMSKLIHHNLKVAAIITDPPYGITLANWDKTICLEAMWKKLDKLIDPRGRWHYLDQNRFPLI